MSGVIGHLRGLESTEMKAYEAMAGGVGPKGIINIYVEMGGKHPLTTREQEHWPCPEMKLCRCRFP